MGKSRPRARTPNTGYYRIAGFPDGGLNPSSTMIHRRFEFKPGDINPDWQDIDDVELVVYNYWTDCHFPIQSIDRGNSIVTLKYPSKYPFLDGNKGSTEGARYIVNNVREAMDEPGEWYLNRKSGLLSYIPKEGEKISEVQIVAPMQPSLVEFSGTPETLRWVRNLQFKGITFEHVNFHLPEGNVNFPQGANSVTGAIILEGAKFVRFENCSFKNLGTFAFDIRNGSSDCAFVANKITHVGAGGFKINGGKEASPPFQRVSRLEIRDNLISNFGEVYASAVGILLMNADGCLILNNEISYGRYSGISVGWTWGYERSVSWNNRIEFNYIHHIGLNTLSDLGGIYTLGVSPGTTIRNNVIHDVTCGLNYGFGIYLDEGTTHVLVENNIVFDTDWAPFHINYGKENHTRNNIFAFGRLDQISLNHIQPHNSFYFENNIVYWSKNVPLYLKNLQDIDTETVVLYKHKPETRSSVITFTNDWNVYYNPSLTAGELKFPNDVSWDEWKAKGKDVHSVYADPLFVDPEKRDFRLKPESPAFKLGFLPIDTSHVGPQQKPGAKIDKITNKP